MKFVIVFLFACLSCQFTISEDKVKKEFENNPQVPQLGKVSVGERTINYAYINRGKRNLAVFVHGSPGSWNAFIDYFKNDSLLEHTDILSIDRPGFGDSDNGWPEPNIGRQAALMKAVTDKFPHSNKVLIGHSLGGPVISRMAMDYPTIFGGLVLVAPSIDPEMEKDEWYRSWIKTKAGAWVTPGDFWVSNEEIMPLKEELFRMVPLWEKVVIPCIIIQGKKDMLVPWENAEFGKKMLKKELVQVRYLEGVNHFIPWSDPETIVQAIFDLI